MAPRLRSALFLCLVGCSGRGGPGGAAAGPAATGATPAATPVVAASTSTAATAAVTYATIATSEVDGAPLSLTTEDGNGLTLAAMDAKVVVEGPLAFTELHLRFTNPDARVREGRFQITLPSGAAVNRFAMKNDGGWMEAEMVERSVARRAYEDFLHRKTDPALLEKQAGNEFAARVFPIPAKADKELVLSYTQELGEGPYVLPLRGLPAIGLLHASARVLRASGAAPAWDETTLSEKGWQPDRDFAVKASDRPAAVASGELVAARVVPDLGVGAEPIRAATILVDDSASRALGWDHAVDDVGQMISAVAKEQGDPRITVAAFDQEVASIYEGPASGWGASQAKKLRARGALGASDLGMALAWAKAHGGADRDRVVLVTDGVATAGATDSVALAAAATATGAKRLDVVLAGGIRDDAAARALARALPDTGAVLDLARGPDEVARRLGLGTKSSVGVSVAGATWVWPTTLDGLQPGDGATIYAELGAGARGKPAAVTIGDRATTVVPASVPRPLVERAAAEAQVLRMEAEAGATADQAAREALTKKIVDLSVRERVLSDETALLVLETDADYARYGLDRRALADILVVGKDGLELAHRDAPAVIAAPATTVTKGEAKEKGREKDAKHKLDLANVVDKPESQNGADDEAEELQKKTATTDDPSGGAGERGLDHDEVTALKVPADSDRGTMGRLVADPALEEPKPASVETPAPAPEPPAPPQAPRVESSPPGASVSTGHGGGGGGGGGNGYGTAGHTPMRAHHRAPDRELYVDGVIASGERDGDGDGDGADRDDDDDLRDAVAPWTGDYADIMNAIGAGHGAAALDRARVWHAKSPGDLLGLVALGDALEATGDRAGAARAYGSIIDLFPARADLRRFAGERLERIADRDPSVSRALALDTYQRAEADRPDHLTGHRLYAYALLRAGRFDDALAAIERGLDQRYPSDRFRGGDRILREDLGLVGAAWAKAEPGKRAAIAERIAKRGGALATGASTRFVLYWETDDNDVDFHIRDAHGGHAFYKRMHLRSGGELYADVTTGYGPEEFAIQGGAHAGPYHLQIHYFSRGPMGYGMGTLEILHRDAGGALTFEHRPFIVMNDKAYVDLGTVAK
jgi:hypothetical protein